MNTAVKVALRVRPLTLQEQINNCAECIAYVPNEPQIGIVGSDKSFTFDYVFDEESTQQQVFEQCAKELVEKFVAGFNVTILAYGQTGSGKTYSMGTGLQYRNDADPAIVPRSAKLIFDLVSENAAKDPTFEARIYVSFLELYNEELIDLLNPEPKNKREQITVREDGLGGISWHGVKEHEVKSPQELMDWLQRGSYGRTTASTDMNQASSRSHAIFSVVLRQQRAEEPEQPEKEEAEQSTAVVTRNSTERPLKKLHSKFHFVDLAGSERLKRTRAVGDRAKEGISINSGLLALGNVISALGDESRRASHVPYRDSKLTRLLQDSLGGNSATLMLACVSAADVDANETLSTLVYANRARNIRNRVVINQDFRDSANAEVAQLRAEINRLKMENSAFRAMGAGAASQMDQRRAAEEIRALRGEVTRLRERLKESSAELCDVLAERDTLLVEREVTGDANIEAHPIMTTYHRTVMLLKDRLIAAEDQALELQNLLTQQQASVFARRQGQTQQPPLRRRGSYDDEDHDADSEHDDDQGRLSPRGRRSPTKRKGQKSSRASSKFDFGSTTSLLKGSEPAKLPSTPSMPDINQTLAPGGASAWFQNLKSEENDPLAHLSRDGSYSSSGSSLKQPRLPTTTATDSDSSYSFSRRSRGSRHGSGGMGDSLDKAKEDIRRGLLLLKAEKSGMDLNLINFLDPASSAVLHHGSARGSGSSYRRDSIMSSSSGMTHRSHPSHHSSHRSRGSQYPGLDDIVAAAISPIQESFPMESPSGSSWKEKSGDDEKVFHEAEQKAAETLANAMKAMHQFTFPISQSDIEQHPLVIKPVSGSITPKDIMDIEKDAEMHLENARKAMESIAAISSDHRSLKSGDSRSMKSGDARSVKSGGDETAMSTIDGPDSENGGKKDTQNLEAMLAEGQAVKSALIQQLERAELEYQLMKQQYEDEIRELELRIYEIQQERDRAMNVREEPNSEKISALKIKYETKIRQLTAELSELQHKYSEVSKIANEKRSIAENQLRTLKLAVETLKAEKQRMIKRMKEDAERIKEINAANDREIQMLRRSERAAIEGRKKAEREVELQILQQQRTQALLHKQSQGGNSAARTVINFLKKAQTPKGISKAPKKAPRLGTSPEPNLNDVKSSGYGASRIPGRTKGSAKANSAAQGSSKLRAAQKKQVIDRAIYGYITGRHTIAVMEDLMQKRERLRSEKAELELERERVVKAQEEEAIANGDIVLDFASEPQYMDDRLAMIDAEMAYFTARLRALQAEAVALGMVSPPETTNPDGGHRSDDEELMTQLQLIRKGMNEDAMGLPPGSGAANAFDSSIKILRSMDLPETRDFLEMLFEDMVAVRTHENALNVQVSHQEKVIEELKRALQAMRRTAIGATESYERRCDGLVAKLRELGFRASAQQGDTCSSSSSRNSLDAQSADSGDDRPLGRVARNASPSSDEDSNGKKDSDVEGGNLGMSMRSGSAAQLPSPTSPTDEHESGNQNSKNNWTPLPETAKPRPGSMAEIVLDEKLASKRASTIFDQLYDDAIKTSETATPKVGGSSGEFSRLLMANSEQRRVSFSGIPRAGSADLTGWASADKENEDHRRLTRSSSTSAIGNSGPRRTSASSDHLPLSKSPSQHGPVPPTPRSRPSSMYGHHRSDSGHASGTHNPQHQLHHARSMSSMGHHQEGGHHPTHTRSHSSYQQPTASSRRKTVEQSETIAARRGGGAATPIAIPPKSNARSRLSGSGPHSYGSSADHGSHLQSPLTPGADGGVHPLYQQRGRASVLSIHTGLPPNPDPMLRHAKSHGAMGHQRNSFGGSGGAAVGSRPSTPSRKFFRSDSDTAVSSSALPPTPGANFAKNGGHSRPLSRIGAASMMTTTPTATNMVHGADGFNNGCADPHHHQHYHMAASRRVSGSWDDNQNVFERLASVHTQASQARVMATRSSGSGASSFSQSHASGGTAGGTMMASGNLSSPGFQQLLQQQQQYAEGAVNAAAAALAGASYPPQRRLSHQPSFERQKLMQQMHQQQQQPQQEQQEQQPQPPSRPASTVPPDQLGDNTPDWPSSASSSSAMSLASTMSAMSATSPDQTAHRDSSSAAAKSEPQVENMVSAY
ncbi:Kinesin-like protein kif21b [Actinomortierella wolfii]|nr:Kinesin-like protein kif21b [Actinomortierella wolfii]